MFEIKPLLKGKGFFYLFQHKHGGGGEGLMAPPNHSVPTALQQQCGGLIISEMNFTTKLQNTHDAEIFLNSY